jgi:hypothetical protein
MKNTWMGLAGLCFLVLAGVGCGNPVSNVRSTLEGTIVAVCESCPLAFGEGDTDACVARTPALFLDETWDCVEENYSSADEPFWNCYGDAYDRFDACVRPLLTPCPTEAGIEGCRDELEVAREACPLPPAGFGPCFEE